MCAGEGRARRIAGSPMPGDGPFLGRVVEESADVPSGPWAPRILRLRVRSAESAPLAIGVSEDSGGILARRPGTAGDHAAGAPRCVEGRLRPHAWKAHAQ